MSNATISHERRPQVAAQPRDDCERPEGAKVAYLMSRFPKLTETFVIYEILALAAQGIEVVIFPLLRARNSASHPEGASLWRKLAELFRKPNAAAVMHPEVRALVERAHYRPFFSWRILLAHLHYVVRRPRAYGGALWTLVRANWGSRNYLAGSLAVFPKVVSIAREIERAGITHVHAHFANHPAAAAFVVHRLTGVPFSFTAHGADLQVDQHMLREKVREAERVVTISNHNKEFIVATCGEECRHKISVIHCGVDTEVFRPAEAAPPVGQASSLAAHVVQACSPDRTSGDACPTGSRPFTILCIGTMYEVKGHPHLIEACRLLKERGMHFVCRLVGDGPDREALARQVAQAGLERHVVFEGLKTRGEIARLHREADVLTLPSVPTASGRREGIPVVLMEAMASGLPVVSTNISGIPELVEHGRTGLLVAPRDPAGLADALERLGRDEGLRRRLGRDAREKILSEFDLHSNAAALAAHFRGGDE